MLSLQLKLPQVVISEADIRLQYTMLDELVHCFR